MDLTSFIKSAKRPLIVILGPTASGKTALSLKVAKQIKGEIISADSRQLYKGMKIATDALPKNKRKNIPHHLMEIVPPDKTLTLAEYKDMALEKIEEIYKRGHVPVIVGGTGLYISAITEGYSVPRIPPNEKLRKKLYEEVKKHGPEYLHEKLKKLDPKAAAKIHPNNIRYVVRAIEINLESKNHKTDKKRGPKLDVYMIGLSRPRPELYSRINARVDAQIKRGLIKEVRALLKKYDPDLPSMSSLGVKEIIPYLRGETTLDQATELLKKNTRNYAKRQMTWFRRYDKVEWLRAQPRAEPSSEKRAKITKV
ncbi:MAG: tRNA (adenosine(37)-N6)-dimethylallyltransferase MiaA [Candidatus Gracilibacteria bacterium]|jgi:tRNA dimethylallyltransferase